MKTAVQIAESKKSRAMFAGRPHVLLERGWIAFRTSTWIPVLLLLQWQEVGVSKCL